MEQIKRVGDLEIDQDLEFQRRESKIERVLWVVAAVLLVLALLGLFGTGPLSSTTAESDDGSVAVDYQRFVRHEGVSSLAFEVSGEHATDGEIELWISQDYIDNVRVESISPQPQEVRSAGDRTIYVFAVDEPGDALTATFSLRSLHMGRLSGDAGSGETTVSVSQISYP